MMLNVYSCGCTALDVPIVSQCGEHGGNVVAATENVVKQNEKKAFMTKDKKSILFYSNILEGMQKLKDASVGLVFSYPDHFDFYARSFVVGSAYRDFPDKYFPECRRILKEDGSIVLIVEHTILASVVYCAFQSGFKIANQFLVPMRISDHPIKHDFVDKYYSYKVGIVFSTTRTKSKKECKTLRQFEKHALSLYNSGLILDTSCIHYPFIVKARSKAKTVGVVSNKSRYASLKERLSKLSA